MNKNWMWEDMPNTREAELSDLDTFTTLDGRVIPYTRNGAITQEAWEAIEEKSLALDRDYRRLNGLED